MSEEGCDPAPRESFVAIVENDVSQRGLLNVQFMANWQTGVYKQVRDSIEELIRAVEDELEHLSDPG